MDGNKKIIVIDADRVINGWSGGLHYVSNITFLLSRNQYINENYDVLVYCRQDQKEHLLDLSPDMKLHVSKHTKGFARKLEKFFLFLNGDIKVLYWGNFNLYLNTKTISWIQDFQHNHYPQYFSKKDYFKRNLVYSSIAKNPWKSMVLSSEDCLNDFTNFYGPLKCKPYVVRFVSNIERIIRALSKEREDAILTDKGISDGKYACVMNQFWQHKNHKVVFDAIINLYTKHPDCNLKFVFTGIMEDYRNPEYIQSLKVIANDPLVAPHIKMLGFISKEEQVAIMKNAEFIIQPSLFEGWGTVVEEAKVLDKTILLSDISVHREQKSDKCILFDPHDADALAELINNELQVSHNDDIEKGIADMYTRAEAYSKNYERLIKDLEK